jgi:hypothetical protein
MAERRSASAPRADREVVIERTFAASRDLVFRAWTEPEFSFSRIDRPRRRGGDAAAIRQPNAALSRSFLIQVSQPLKSRSDMSRLQLSQ